MAWLRAIVNPNRKILLFFSLPIGLICFFLNYILSFSLIPLTTILFFFGLSVYCFLALMIDIVFKTRFIKYSLVFIIVFPLSHYTFKPLIPSIKDSAKNKGEILVRTIQDYKKKNGHYPNDLNDPLLKDAPKFASILIPFHYETYVNEKDTLTFNINYITFHGWNLYYYADSGKWRYQD